MNARTVLGDVPGDALGVTLPHEHILFDVRDYWEAPTEASRVEAADRPLTIEQLGRVRYDPFLLRDNLLHEDENLATEELLEYVELGGATIVDPTNVSMGRDPLALARIARRTGLHVIMGSGYYTEISLGPAFDARSDDELVQEFVDDVRIGVGDTSIRAGLIGEIGTSSPITTRELRSLRAAAAAAAVTGAPLMVHLDGWAREGHAVLDVIAEEGADAHQAILCHMNPSCEDLTYQASLADRGAFIEYDMLGMTYVYPVGRACPDDQRALRGVRKLLDAGYGERILISQDVFLRSMLRRFGGLGYTHILTGMRSVAHAAGIEDDDLHRFLTTNAHAAFATFPEDSPAPLSS